MRQCCEEDSLIYTGWVVEVQCEAGEWASLLVSALMCGSITLCHKSHSLLHSLGFHANFCYSTSRKVRSLSDWVRQGNHINRLRSATAAYITLAAAVYQFAMLQIFTAAWFFFQALSQFVFTFQSPSCFFCIFECLKIRKQIMRPAVLGGREEIKAFCSFEHCEVYSV